MSRVPHNQENDSPRLPRRRQAGDNDVGFNRRPEHGQDDVPETERYREFRGGPRRTGRPPARD